MTTQREFLAQVIGLLDEAGVPYMVAGSLGSSFHGHPRATQDADLVIDPTSKQLESFLGLLERGYYVSREAAFEAWHRRTMFNIIDLAGGWKADLIFRKERPFSRQEFQRRQQMDVLGRRLWVASPEDTILSKLEWMKGRASEVQYADALGVALAQGDDLDLEYLRRWAGELGVDNMLARLLLEAAEQAKRNNDPVEG
ncbi:MAG: nucleotidyltransferase family protein [Planctomycetes bacterium]|nr:nucleotidyltransferase family protein [Planctomycetota bacterium]